MIYHIDPAPCMTVHITNFVFCSGSWLNEKKNTNTNHTVMITFQIRDDTDYFVT